MVMRDTIRQMKNIQYKYDSMGGRAITDSDNSDIKCRASFNVSPEVASEYGTHGEQVLYVITSEALNKEVLYFFEEKTYSVRETVHNNRFYHTILVEVKE